MAKTASYNFGPGTNVKYSYKSKMAEVKTCPACGGAKVLKGKDNKNYTCFNCGGTGSVVDIEKDSQKTIQSKVYKVEITVDENGTKVMYYLENGMLLEESKLSAV